MWGDDGGGGRGRGTDGEGTFVVVGNRRDSSLFQVLVRVDSMVVVSVVTGRVLGRSVGTRRGREGMRPEVEETGVVDLEWFLSSILSSRVRPPSCLSLPPHLLSLFLSNY